MALSIVQLVESRPAADKQQKNVARVVATYSKRPARYRERRESAPLPTEGPSCDMHGLVTISARPRKHCVSFGINRHFSDSTEQTNACDVGDVGPGVG